MGPAIGVGLSLPPDAGALDLLEPLLLEEVDLYELCPETTWLPGPGEPRPNGYWRTFRALQQATGRPVLAHCVGLDLAGPGADRARRQRWLRALGRDAAAFDFPWLTCHLGASVLAGEHCTLPIPVPWDGLAIRRVRRRLRALRRVLGDRPVGFENNVGYMVFGNPLAEADAIAAILEEPGTVMLLDLHNLWTMSRNHGFAVEDWLGRVPLDRVVEIHVSGGSESPPSWLPGGRSLRLDSHDGPVPEAVWALLEVVLPRCPSLKAVVLERMEGSFSEPDIPALQQELRRIREALGGRGR